jgi:hypothetical protein
MRSVGHLDRGMSILEQFRQPLRVVARFRCASRTDRPTLAHRTAEIKHLVVSAPSGKQGERCTGQRALSFRPMVGGKEQPPCGLAQERVKWRRKNG